MDYCKHGRAVVNTCIECTCLEQVEEMERELAQVKSAGVRKIAQARAYQSARFDDAHDDAHTDNQLPRLAACYAIDADVFTTSPLEPIEPSTRWWNRNPFPGQHVFPKLPLSKKIQMTADSHSIVEKDAVVIKARIANLAKAGALIAAEIDRLSRRLTRQLKTT